MTATADHRADIHQLVAQRRAAGQPVWRDRVRLTDLLADVDDTIGRAEVIELRSKLAARFRDSSWFRHGGNEELAEVLEELDESVDSASYLDAVLDRIYDLADWDRVWIETS